MLSKLPIQTHEALKSAHCGHLLGSSLALWLAEAVSSSDACHLVVVPEPQMTEKLAEELRFFLSGTAVDLPIHILPDAETLAYDRFSPHQDIISERLGVLYQLPKMKKGILLVCITTLMQRICPRDHILRNAFCLKVGQTLELDQLQRDLTLTGYLHVAQVMEHGEFTRRGSIVDLFPMGSEVPYRIDLFDNEIDSIRTFDPETQKSITKIDEIRLLPAREFPLDQEGITRFRTEFRDRFPGNPTDCDVYLDVSEGWGSPGLEYYLPLFFEKISSLFDYVPDHTQVITLGGIEEAAQQFWQEIKERHERYRHDRLRPILEPSALFLQVDELFREFKSFTVKKADTASSASKPNLPVERAPTFSIESRQESTLEQLALFLKTYTGRVLFCAESMGRREILKELLSKIDCHPAEVDEWSHFLDSSAKFVLTVAPLEEGLQFADSFVIITETELFGRRVLQKRLRKNKYSEISTEVKSLAELNEGSPVVHVDYGIGRYQGLVKLTVSEEEAEFVALEYAGNDKLYVPVASLDLISRYSGVDLEHVKLSRLGTEQWQKVKHKALEQARDTAAELLEIYAKREAKTGLAFAPPDDQYDVFSQTFPFEETPDQQRAIEQVLQDLTSLKPMDRVVCGDVGFGKTEVALRATFLAVHSGKQVAILVPTTLLAEQHFQTFSDRFAKFPIRVEVVSRFRSQQEQEQILGEVKTGKIDILIGTHKILQSSVEFASLGLLIIDEEHRFGVRQKEAFKAMRSEVDILTLTATPIPRTLNMAMTGLRDLSIIATPPARRLSIKTFVREKNNALIDEAVSRELHRGGQVYYLHNSVETIENEARFLRERLPNARVAVAHGQMRERELEQVMSDFYHRKFNVLVCTTIIETGIDVPTANTIIIDRADKFGLAQLHQLRGRVGRSHHQAYAFCLLPPKAKITSNATKRLDALANMEDLGSGFTLATQDLEIRGAGELLGESQSGNIQSVGFNLYMELLDQAVRSLKQSGIQDKPLAFRKGIEVELQISALLPEAYVPDVYTRLILYKRISGAASYEHLDEIVVELIDRFGQLPDQTKNLLTVARLKIKAATFGIQKIECHGKGGRIEFSEEPKVDPQKIIKLIQTQPDVYQLDGPQKLRFKLDLNDKKVRATRVAELLDQLS